MVLRGGVVVHHGRIAAVSRNGAEALHDELIGIAAVLVQDLVHGQLSQGLTGSKALLQLDLEPHHGHGVPDVGFLGVSQLGVVLYALHHQQGVGAVLHGEGRVLLQHLIHGVVDGGRLSQHGLRLGLGCHEVQHGIILSQRHTVGGKLGLCFRGDTGGVDEQHSPVRGDVAVGHRIGGALDVHGAEVQQPREVIQLAHELRRAALLLELCAQLVQLFGRGKARIFLRQDPRRGVRQGRTAFGPQLVLEIQRLDDAVLRLQRLFQAVDQRGVGGQAAQTQRFALAEDLCAVFFHGGHARLAHAHQLDLGAGDLLFSLHKVPAVGPQGTLGAGDDKVGVLAVEAREVGQAGVVVGQVFAGVGVAHRDQINSHAVCGHGLAQSGKPLGNGIHAHIVLLSAGKTPGGGNFYWFYCIISRERLQCGSTQTQKRNQIAKNVTIFS